MSEQFKETISVVGVIESDATASLGGRVEPVQRDSPGDRAWRKRPAPVEVPVAELESQVAGLVSAMQRIAKGLPATESEFSVSQLEFALEVSASGKVALLGTGVELAGKGGVTVTLTRSPSRTRPTRRGS